MEKRSMPGKVKAGFLSVILNSHTKLHWCKTLTPV